MPFFLGAIFLSTPIVMVLTKHQQKMAQILRGRQEEAQPTENERMLMHEVATLRQMVAQQTIALDNLAQAQQQLARSIGPSQDIERVYNP